MFLPLTVNMFELLKKHDPMNAAVTVFKESSGDESAASVLCILYDQCICVIFVYTLTLILAHNVAT